jgi:hypothetical protein
VIPQSTVGDSSSTPFFRSQLLSVGLPRIGKAKFGFNPLLPTCLRQADQQLMTEPLFTVLLSTNETLIG